MPSGTCARMDIWPGDRPTSSGTGSKMASASSRTTHVLVNRVQPFPRVRYSQQALHNDLRRLQKAWRAYQESRRRDAIYEFLGCVLEILTIWTVDKNASGRSRQALALSGAPTPAANEPFVLLITAAAHPHRVDERTLSKWTRVLQFAAEHKLPSTPLET